MGQISVPIKPLIRSRKVESRRSVCPMPCFGLLNLCVISSAARSLEYLHVSFPQSFNLATRPVPNGGAFQTPELPGASAMTAKQAPSRENPVLVDTFEERHFTLAEIAKMWPREGPPIVP
jgi:hypothetical protein